MLYTIYGLLVGLSMGFGLIGLIVAAVRTLCGRTRKIPQCTMYLYEGIGDDGVTMTA
jgi:hypothetical protein